MTANVGYNPPPGLDATNGGPLRPGPGPLPHVQDVVAVPNDIDGNQSLKRLLEQAEASMRQSAMCRDLERPALALKEYIRASIIAIQVIANHKDYPALRASQGESARAHAALLRRISQQSDVYEQIKRDIIQDNKRTGVQPTIRRSTPSGPSSRSSSANGRPLAPIENPSAKAKPIVHPKPQALHGNAIRPGHGRASSTASAAVDLAARFANLRGPQSSPGQDPRIKTYPIPTQKPAGARAMPTPNGPVTNASISVLPKMPDAIYSPARGSTPGEAAPLSTKPRAPLSRTGSSASVASALSTSQHAPPINALAVPPENQDSIDLADGDSITPEQLYGTMKGKASILLIDIRAREEFDEGHIMARTVICIEPSILLRENISSDEISESMVLSPLQDQPLFEKRDGYDLVVFYDQSSERVVELPRNSDELVVVAMHRALVHLNYGRELKRRPMILEGGLDAWVDLMGSGSLQSTAAASSGSARSRKRNGFVQRRGSKYTVRSLQPADVKAWQTALEQDAQHTAMRPAFPRTGEEYLRLSPMLAQGLPKPSMTSPVSAGPPAAPGQRLRAQSPRFDLPAHLPAPPARPRAAVPRHTHSGLSNGMDDVGPYSELGAAPMARIGLRSRESYTSSLARRPTGLSNPRNWCYANSTLQALLASPEFSRELTEGSWEQKYQAPRKDGEKIDPPQLMARMISNLFHWMTTGNFTVKAQTLMDYSRKLCESTDGGVEFGGHQQQDAQEFMSFVMDQMHDETNIVRDRDGQLNQPNTKGKTVFQAAAEYWDNHKRLNQSMIDRYWRGLEVSTVRCLECGTNTYNFSLFSWLSTPVGTERSMTLADAMALYAGHNELDDFKCDQCRRSTKAVQWASLGRMPPLLCLGLRRFDINPAGHMAKATTVITWDFNDVDFTPYSMDAAAGGGRPAATGDRAFCGPFRYECYAVICHAGNGILSGHYKAYVRDSSTHDPYAWYLCDDDKVIKVRIGSNDGADVQQRVFSDGFGTVPYLVFFRRKGA